MASTALLSLAALSLSGIAFAENVDWANAGTFWGQPLVGNGPYGFGACNPTQAAALQALFAKAGGALEQQIIPEVNKGSQSVAFNTFFSTNGSEIPKWSQNGLSVPQEVFSDIDNGPWHRTVDKLPINDDGGPVIFACTNPADPSNPDNVSGQEASIKCGDGIAAAKFTANETDTSAGHWLLCDNFWNNTLYTDLPVQDMCPTYDDVYGFLPSDGNQVKDTRLGLIIQMLAQIYSKNVGATRPDLQDINSAINQDFSMEVANPTNYDWFGTMVAAGCTSWPNWADPNYNATAAAEAFFNATTGSEYTDDTSAGAAIDPSTGTGAKRRSVSIRGRQARGLIASNEEPKVLQTRSNHRAPNAPPLNHDPRMSTAGELGTINEIPAALMPGLMKLANLKPSNGKLGITGKTPGIKLSEAGASLE